jgi:hypothetical protein
MDTGAIFQTCAYVTLETDTAIKTVARMSLSVKAGQAKNKMQNRKRLDKYFIYQPSLTG